MNLLARLIAWIWYPVALARYNVRKRLLAREIVSADCVRLIDDRRRPVGMRVRIERGDGLILIYERHTDGTLYCNGMRRFISEIDERTRSAIFTAIDTWEVANTKPAPKEIAP